MHIKWNAIINFFKKSGIRLYQFLRLEDVILIQKASWICKQAIGMVILP